MELNETKKKNPLIGISLRKRSDSLSSDNSLTSQSTLKYRTPMVYPSESSSSSRPVSRQSNCSGSSSGIIPRIPTPSRSATKKKSSTTNKTTKRASHIPTSPTSSRATQIPKSVVRSPTPRLFSEEKRIPSPTQRPSGLRPPNTRSKIITKPMGTAL
ncbi:unnamed protein product [Rhizopus stolonifer]